MTNLPNLILRNLIQRESFCRKALPHIKSEYFEGTDRIVYELILSFITKYNKLPNSPSLQVEYEESDLNKLKSAEVLSTIQTLAKKMIAKKIGYWIQLRNGAKIELSTLRSSNRLKSLMANRKIRARAQS